MLALRTFHATAVWKTEHTLWTQAAGIAPLAPRPWLGLAWVALRHGDLAQADRLLDRAQCGTFRQPRTEREWAIDSIEATRATLRLRQGRVQEAAVLMAGAPWASERQQLCQRYPSVCALAP